MVLQRNEINEKDTWDLSTIYPTDQAWEEALKDLTEQLETVAQYEGHLLDSADNLLEITEFSLEMERQMEKLYVYAHMKNDQDTREAKYQEYYAKAMTLYSQLDQAFSFYDPEFMEISEKQYADFLEAQPKLQVYQHYFDKLLKGKDHVLSQREEELLAGAGEIFGSASETFAILDNADIVFPYVLDDDGKEVQLSHGTYTRLMESKNVRFAVVPIKLFMRLTNNSNTPMPKPCKPMLRCKITVLKFVTTRVLVMQPSQRILFQKVFMTIW